MKKMNKFMTIMATVLSLTACMSAVQNQPMLAISNANSDLEISGNSASKGLSDGSHIKDSPLTRDFILANQLLKLESGNSKINSIKPDGEMKPRAVVLLDKNIFRSGLYVKKKNLELCKGYMTLPLVEDIELRGIKTGDEQQANRKNHVITYMPTLLSNKNNLPKDASDCSNFLANSYDYKSAEDELNFIFNGRVKGTSPYLVVYESPTSPYSSMILSLGKASPETILILAKNWSDLLVNVYQHGDAFDPVIGIATMIKNDPALQQAQKEAMLKNIELVFRGSICGIAIAAETTITLEVVLSLQACQPFYQKAKDALGYSG